MRRLKTEGWGHLAAEHDRRAALSPAPGTSEHTGVQLIGAVLDLEERVAELAVLLEDSKDREGFNARLAALEAARKHVDGLPSEQQNSRGYRDHAIRAPERTALELQVAAFLLGGRA